MILRIFCLFMSLVIVITPHLHWSSGKQNFTPSQLSHPALRLYPSVDHNYTTAKIEISRRNQERKFRSPQNDSAEPDDTAQREPRLYPMKCYTCSGLVSKRDCGDNFRKSSFLARECDPGKKFCMKLVETTGGSSFMYRKCTNKTCEEEIKVRHGQVSDCSICSRSMCNEGPSLRSKTIFFSAVAICYFWYHYISS